jgi:leucyl aminopeptidase
MNFPSIDFKQTRQRAGEAQIDMLSAWTVVLPEEDLERSFARMAYGPVLAQRSARLPGGLKPNTPFTTDLPNAAGSRVALATVGRDIESFELLTLARKLVAVHATLKPAAVGVYIAGFRVRAAERIAEAMLAAILAAVAPMPDRRSKPEAPWGLGTIQLFGVAPGHRFRRSFAELEGSSLARYLAALPPNELTPTQYRKQLAIIAKENGLTLEFYGINDLKKKKAGAFLAVAQGSPVPDAGIARLRYQPPRAARQAPVALVGKGICFDTGGVNVKPAKSMLGMQGDMQGSAVALGTLLALAKMKANFPAEAWLALAMNHVGPNAYKPTDIVTASNGTTIEVIHTDAEGRMVLSDTLALCSATKPRMIIDYATLTGACVYSLGKAYSGVFTNRPKWWMKLIDCGRDSGERVWPFPLDKDYDRHLESSIADVKQCYEEGQADHILAARFLSRFVDENIPWVHLDLSSANCKGGLAHVPTDFNGFGVRFTLNLLLDAGLGR